MPNVEWTFVCVLAVQAHHSDRPDIRLICDADVAGNARNPVIQSIDVLFCELCHASDLLSGYLYQRGLKPRCPVSCFADPLAVHIDCRRELVERLAVL